MLHFWKLYCIVCTLGVEFHKLNAAESPSVLVIIRSQSNDYHSGVALKNKQSLDAQIEQHNLNANVVLLHKEWPQESSWTIMPILPDLSKKYTDQFDWIMFIEETTKVEMNGLIRTVLPKYDFNENMYIGRCLFDNDPSIIHHYAYFDGKLAEFKFPDFHAGWLLSKSLVKRITSNWDLKKMRYYFQIDIQHEMAMLLNKNFSVKMTCAKEFCGSSNDKHCVTWLDYNIPYCGDRITLDDVLISVKTTLKFHSDRVQVVKGTWGKYAKNIIYYSNVTDPTVPTVDCGVPNTPIGHCGKMEVIIRRAYEDDKLKRFPWLVIADDDSIIGLSALLKLLNCYKPNVPMVLGERYGFGLLSDYGYAYITGGGSMVLSRAAVEAWVEKGCACPNFDSPDDMVLGQCFSYNVGVPVTHSPRFHQARPDDYSDGYLGNLQPVSFHKHFRIDPYKVYAKYFADDDEARFVVAGSPEPTSTPPIMPVPIPPTPTEVPIRDEL